jgi:DNA helicase II / ATP-dependent DNA helicase PcrA
LPKQVSWFIAGSKEDGRRPRDVRSATSRRASWSRSTRLYEDQCQREGVVDFGELMLRTYELLRDNDPVREHYQRRFRHIWSTSSRTPTACSTPG